MVKPELTEDEVVFLSDLVDFWLEGYDEATSDVITDRSFDTPEELLYAINSMHKGFALATTVREKLGASRAASTV